MLKFELRTNADDFLRRVAEARHKDIQAATLKATDRAGRYVFNAIRSEMQEVFDRPTPWTIRGLRYLPPDASKPLVRVWLDQAEQAKGTPAGQFLAAEIEGQPRKHKRFERALIAKGLMPGSMFAVPGQWAPRDAYGNVPASFIVAMLRDLQAFSGDRARLNRQGKRRGARKTNYFFVPAPGSTLKPGVYRHLPNGLLGVAFMFVSQAAYEKSFDFFGVARRAHERVAKRFLAEEMRRVPGIR